MFALHLHNIVQLNFIIFDLNFFNNSKIYKKNYTNKYFWSINLLINLNL